MITGNLAELIRANLAFPPTADQNSLFEQLGAFSADPVHDMMIIAGYAGTGKTSAVAAFVKTLKQCRRRFVLLAPTGRAAKVLQSFTGYDAFTIHKYIYRQKSLDGAFGKFSLDINKLSDTFFIVDEASLITIDTGGGNLFGSGDLLEDLVKYVRSKPGNKLVFIGDRGQLPPIGMDESPALDIDFMQSTYGQLYSADLKAVVRQEKESGILHNATIVRNMVEAGVDELPQLETDGFDDIKRITGGELIESLNDSIGRYGLDDVVVLCRSNKRANRYNAGIRGTVLYREEQLTKGDKLMVVKNCYQFKSDREEQDPTFFLANGDMCYLQKVRRYEERYGLHFAEATLRFPDYDDMDVTAKIILDTLDSGQASLTAEQQNALFEGVWADYDDITTKKKRYEAVREDPYFNALQIKYATAITCHKSQGGGWPCVYIDNPFWMDEMAVEDLKWLYTALTRGIKQVFLVNFNDKYFK